jgi:hypothetical protein
MQIKHGEQMAISWKLEDGEITGLLAKKRIFMPLLMMKQFTRISAVTGIPISIFSHSTTLLLSHGSHVANWSYCFLMWWWWLYYPQCERSDISTSSAIVCMAEDCTVTLQKKDKYFSSDNAYVWMMSSGHWPYLKSLCHKGECTGTEYGNDHTDPAPYP